MRKIYLLKTLLLAGCMSATSMYAQLSSNPDKFLGNITTRNSVNGGGVEFASLWNQITPENESKWEIVEGGAKGSFNWTGCDNAYNYAKRKGIPFKFHCLIWGAQYPDWLNNMTTAQQYNAIKDWMDAVKKRYPDLPLIDVVNEAVPGHQPAPYKEALGGDGKTGYDWIIKAFEMAHERWPNAILIYNDYNTFQYQRYEFINLVKTLRDAGAPIDAYGCQSHDLTDMDFTSFKSAMTEIQNELKMPMYSTEYDIGTSDDDHQLQQYKNQIKYMWESDYVAGITLWGYIYGATWTTDGNSGIIKNGVYRPAMTWLKEYMATDAAKKAKSPFPGFKKEASVYVKPQSLNAPVNEETTIDVRASLRTKTIERVELYGNNVLMTTMTEAPYIFTYTPTRTGKVNLKAIVYDTEGNKYERLSSVNVHEPRKPFGGKPIEIPGTIEAENYDIGADGVTYHDSDTKKEGDASTYRSNGGYIDIVKGNGGYALGYTASGEWMEYTVDVKEAGLYEFDAVASSGATNSSFTISLADNGVQKLAGPLVVPCVTQNSWDAYRSINGRFPIELTEGEHIIRITVNGANCNIDKLILRHIEVNKDIKLTVSANPAPATVNTAVTISVGATCATSDIQDVSVYVNDVLYRKTSTAPYEVKYRPTATGTYNVKVIATDVDGKKSDIKTYSLVVNPKRTPFKGVIAIPGIIEAEDFDICQEGVSYHDSDDKDEGNANYRKDNQGVDIVTGNGGYGIGYTAANEWLEYTVNVTEQGKYSYEATVASGSDNSGFTLALMNNGRATNLTSKIVVPNTGDWNKYTVVKGNLLRELAIGEQTFRLTINGAYCNIDKIKLICTLNTGIEEVITLECNAYDVYTLSGIRVGQIKADGSASLSSQVYELTGHKGTYIIKNTATHKAKVIMCNR